MTSEIHPLACRCRECCPRKRRNYSPALVVALLIIAASLTVWVALPVTIRAVVGPFISR